MTHPVPSPPLRLCLPGSLLAALACGLAVQAHALERVTLRNGFSYDCARQEPLNNAEVRLYLASDQPGSYVDLPSTDIVATEPLPAPAAPAPPANSQPVAAAPDLRSLLSVAGATHHIDVELLASIVHAESSGRAHAVSRTGAQGLMQLMPATAQDLGVRDRFAPEDNIRGGTTYLDALLTRYHDDLALALAAYNAGPGAVDRFHGVPPFRETRAYVRRVMLEFKRRKEDLAQRAPQTSAR